MIPNIELLIYKMFFSPLATRESSQGSNDLLDGNLFADKKMCLPMDVYTSLLQTLAIRPKKKHYKKMIAYIKKVEDKARVGSELLDLVMNECGNYALVSGYAGPDGQRHDRDDMIVVHDYPIDRESFTEFVMFLERCKGFEEDARKFLHLTQ